MRMSTFILKRLSYTVFVLFGLSILIFIIARVLPGDPARLALGPRAADWAVQNLRQQMHLNEPLYIQYFYWVRDAASGSLGESLVTRRDVFTDVQEFLPATLELITLSALLVVALAIPIGMVAGRRANSWFDNLVRVLSYIGVAVPAFVVAIIFLLVFGFMLHIAPSIGRLSPNIVAPPTVTGLITVDSLISGNMAAFFDALVHLILPALALALGPIAQEARITRSSVVENLNKDYILSTVSHGVPERLLTLKYLLRPSLIPTVSVMGLDISSLIANAFLVELIYNWPGISRYGINAMLRKDLNAIVAVVMIAGIIFAIGNIVVDLIVAYLDPRIRYVEKAA
jgi:peptide/nickel transport system permease protein